MFGENDMAIIVSAIEKKKDRVHKTSLEVQSIGSGPLNSVKERDREIIKFKKIHRDVDTDVEKRTERILETLNSNDEKLKNDDLRWIIECLCLDIHARKWDEISIGHIQDLAICKKDCHTAGHYECWKDNCNCICHAARRVLGIALPESYTPVSKE